MAKAATTIATAHQSSLGTGYSPPQIMTGLGEVAHESNSATDANYQAPVAPVSPCWNGTTSGAAHPTATPAPFRRVIHRSTGRCR